MQTPNSSYEHQPLELTGELHSCEGVYFDLAEIMLIGVYHDELSAYRARRNWIETLESSFLLEADYDYSIRVSSPDDERFYLHCAFESASGRYAFWRVTHAQAPEAQYLIETAHVPTSEPTDPRCLAAPDLEPLPGTEAPPPRARPGQLARMRAWLRTLLR